MRPTLAETTGDHPSLVSTGQGPSHWRKAGGAIAVAVVLVGAGVAVVFTKPFSSGKSGTPGVAQSTDATGTYTVARRELSSQTQVAATLGYAGSYNIASPSGVSTQQVGQARQAVAEDQLTLSGDQQTESDRASADGQSIAAAQTNLATARSTLSADQAKEADDCAGTGASGSTCSQDTVKVSQDQTALTQATQQLTSAQSTATQDQDHAKIQVASDQIKLKGDQAMLASDQGIEVNPGTTYTSLPNVGQVIKENQPVYSLNNQPVPLLYGTVPAYRAFYVGMSDGADVGELTADLIALGYGAALTQSDHYSTVTASAVERWQAALGLPATGEVLLGEVVFEPGPIRVTSVTPSVGQSTGGGGGGAASAGPSGGSGVSGGGGTLLTATATTRQVSIALDASEQSEVAVGDKVTIALPNNQTTSGVIYSVGTVATTPPSSGSGSPGSSSPTVTVLVNPTDPAATGTWDQASVNVTITTGTVANALVVPVAALGAQTAGGYAVEAVGADGIHRLVPVSLGLFDDADGLVQVTGTNLAAGEQVVVPKL